MQMSTFAHFRRHPAPFRRTSITCRKPLAGCSSPARHAPFAAWLRVAVAFAWPLLFAVAAAQAPVQSPDLLGPVAVVEEYEIDVESGDRRLVQVRTFDEAGVIVERVAYQYDFRDGSLRSRQVTLFDAGVRLALVSYGADDEPIGQTVYRYDDAGRLVEELSVDADGEETWRTRQEFDAAGHLVRVAQYRAGGLLRTVEYDRDGDGALLEEREFDADGRMTRIDVYDVPGLEYAYTEFDDRGAVEANGRVIEGEFGPLLIEVFDPEGALIESYAWRYDPRGRELERRSAGEFDDVLTYEYVDDAVGNWVRMTVLEDFGYGAEEYEVRERVITYR